MAFNPPPSWDDLPLVLTADETAQLLRVHVSTVKQLCRAGKLRGVKVGRAWRITRTDVMLLEATMEQVPGGTFEL